MARRVVPTPSAATAARLPDIGADGDYSLAGRLRLTLRRMPPSIRLCAGLGVLLVLVAVFADVVAPYDPNAQSLLKRLKPPMGLDGAADGFVLGTDQLGRDMLSRCIHGLQVTLGLASLGAIISLTVGVTLGLTAGLARGATESLIMGLVDLQIAVPFTLVALFIIALAGTDLTVLIAVLGIAYWEQYGRIVRGQVLAVRELPFIEACRAMGASPWRVAWRHVLPNIASPIIVQVTLIFSQLVLLESSLSFLGLGVQPPTASLGAMVGQGRDYMASAWWVVASPAALIVLVALIVLLLGDWLRDTLDVRLS